MSDKPITAYICGTDLRCEMTEPDMLGNCRITPNKDFAIRGGNGGDTWKCVKDCGLAEIEIRFVRWIKEPGV